MTIRPAIIPPQPISLDTLLTRAQGGPARQPSAPMPHHQPSRWNAERHFGKPLDDIEVHSIGTVTQRYEPLSAPTALVLLTTVAACECGRVHRLPNASVFLRYGNDKSIHFRRASLPELPPQLPRQRIEHNLTVPYCEGCF